MKTLRRRIMRLIEYAIRVLIKAIFDRLFG